jgi:hypothetical protein
MNENRKQRILDPLERLINEGSTQGERESAKARWEHITGEKWTSKSKSNNSYSNSKSYQEKYKGDNPFEDIFGKGFSRTWDDMKSRYEHKQTQQEEPDFDFTKDFDPFDFMRRHSQSQHKQGQKRQQWKNESYDFSFNQCTDRQYSYLDSICKFFRWKHPQRNKISFEEAQRFLDKHSTIFQYFTINSRNTDCLRRLLEVLGIDFSDIERTWIWEFEKEGGEL